ncbi:MAG: hypothetical protein K6F77_09180 [Lachnospiraceae bacterium]|nr:hypothetical protein [Lachnospiraceae bacterium]
MRKNDFSNDEKFNNKERRIMRENFENQKLDEFDEDYFMTKEEWLDHPIPPEFNGPRHEHLMSSELLGPGFGHPMPPELMGPRHEHLMPPEPIGLGIGAPVPPHLKHNMVQILFDTDALDSFKKIFNSEDEAYAAMSIINNAPPEFKILAIQLFKLIGVNLKVIFQESPYNRNQISAQWDSPFLGGEVGDIYNKTYGNEGKSYAKVLNTSPVDHSVISRLILYIQNEINGRDK